MATEYEHERVAGSQIMDDDLSGWDSNILEDEKDIYRDDPEPDRDDDDNVFLFECL